jgi:ribosomal protein S18 acetylase RimI-like enzyme
MANVELVPMPAERFDKFMEAEAKRFSEDNLKAGYRTPRDALPAARKDIRNLLPKGRKTPGHEFYIIRDPMRGEVGQMWLMIDPRPQPVAFLYSIFIEEPYRGRGYGRAAMLEAERIARSKGARALFLHMFAGNDTALRLYQSLGFTTRSMNLGSDLD